jgi:hypothetical protein
VTSNNEEDTMQFVLMIYQGSTPLPGTPEWDTLPAEEQKAAYADYAELNRAANVSSGPALGLPQDATSVRVEDGSAVTSDGPYLDVRSAVGGFMIVEADDLDGAIAVARRVPAARLGGAVEVRPSATYW